MICKPCAEGADARGEVARDLGHQRCEGDCPCQHRGTTVERQVSRPRVRTVDAG